MATPLLSYPARWVGIPGTWGAKDQHPWWTKEAPFTHYLRDKLVIYPLKPDQPFVWSTDLDGGFFSFFSSGKHSDWDAAGAAISYYLEGIPLHERNLIAHSHGLQAVLYACGKYGVQINTLTSVASPVRKDMQEIAERARPNIGYWTHIHSDKSDRFQWLGEIGDGTLGIVRKHPLANINTKIPKVGHSGLLTESKNFYHWDSLLYPLFKKWH